jgi:hypothetical protein
VKLYVFSNVIAFLKIGGQTKLTPRSLEVPLVEEKVLQ